MEDSHTHILSMKEDKDASFFAVFDGHGGLLYSCFWFSIVSLLKNGNFTILMAVFELQLCSTISKTVISICITVFYFFRC